MSTVNIVTSDRGWILEKLANEIVSRLDYAKHTDHPDPDSEINYYITYSCWTKRVSEIQIAWFAHLEPLGEANEKFFKAAEQMDHCLTQANIYENLLRNKGVMNVSTIHPGVDLERFNPRLKIGVVGRAYHTGRKGEHLVGQLMDLPEVEWFFTGTGWPGVANEVSDEDLPEFYRSMDYIVVPSLYEGGPMCVVEALACGTQVIAPPIGWVPEFPHIEFATGDAADLKRVLLELFEKKQQLRRAVQNTTWQNWAEQHHLLFQSLLKKRGLRGIRPRGSQGKSENRLGEVALLLHGNEATSQGGPSVRVPRTASELRQRGVRAQSFSYPANELDKYELFHLFNVWSPQSALNALRSLKSKNKTTVFSPIFMDLSERYLWDNLIPTVYSGMKSIDNIEMVLEEKVQKWRTANLREGQMAEPFGGYFAMVREMVGLSDHLIFLSKKERQLLASIGASGDRSTKVLNPVDQASFEGIDGSLFARTYGIRDFVLCVGRIEGRKNQLLLAHALRDTGIPLVLIGHIGSQLYGKLIKDIGGPNVHLLGRLPPGSKLLRSAFRAARVATLPSWSEGAPLAALEAAAAGANLVLSDRSSEQEYFGDLALYADPSSISSIRSNILKSFETARPLVKIQEQIERVRRDFSWERYAVGTAEAYAKCQSRVLRASQVSTHVQTPQPDERQRQIVFDVTTTVNKRGRTTGIARVEFCLVRELARSERDLLLVHWDNRNKTFIQIPLEDFLRNDLARYLERSEVTPVDIALPKPGASYIVAGSGWMQNTTYAEATVTFSIKHELRFIFLCHDLIPVIFPYWYEEKYIPIFNKNLEIVTSCANSIIAISQTTKRDVSTYLERTTGLSRPVYVVREGDSIEDDLLVEHKREKIEALNAKFGSRDFVLNVGAIHARKNQRLLFDIWVRLNEQLGSRCPLLIIVGGVAWNGNDVARAFKSDPRVKGKVLILDEIDDSELNWLYQNCLFTVYPSLYEGWGLPVCESLQHGKVCIASDVPSIREIAPSQTDLIDPLDFSSWLAQVRFYSTSAEARKLREEHIKSTYTTTSWGSCAQDLLEAIRATARHPNVRSRYHLGSILDFSKDGNARRRLRGDWHFSESWGTWSAGAKMSVQFDLPDYSPKKLALVMKCRALMPRGERQTVSAYRNGVLLATWNFYDQGTQLRTAEVNIDGGGLTDGFLLEFRCSDVFAISQVTSAASDARSVGFGVASCILCEISRVQEAVDLLDPDGVLMPRASGFSSLSSRELNRVFAGNWREDSAWGRLPLDDSASILLTPWSSGISDLDLVFAVRTSDSGSGALFVELMLETECLAEWSLTGDDIHSLSTHVNRQFFGKGRNERLRFRVSRAGEMVTECFGVIDILVADQLLAPPSLRDGVGPLMEAPKTLDFTAPKNGKVPEASVLGVGWYPVERSGTWTRGHKSVLKFRLGETFSEGAFVDVTFKLFQASTSRPNGIVFLCNGTIVSEFVGCSSDLTTHSFILSPRVFELHEGCELCFVCDNLASPASRGRSNDARLLGFLLQSVSISPVRTLDPNYPGAEFSSVSAAEVSIGDFN